MSTKYHYRSLSPGTIRLVTLHQGSNDDALQCQIQHVKLAMNRAGGAVGGPSLLRHQYQKYEALSYVWGVLGATEDLICDSGILKITPSLESALKHLRWGHKGRTLWIDQICINQEDLAERSQQVSLMGDIYRSANQVISWLGEDVDGHSLMARNFVTDLSEGKFPSIGNQVPYDANLSAHNWPVRDSPRWKALRAILSLGYWTRLWILQEVVLARRVTLQWGRTEMPFDVLYSCCIFLFENNRGLWETPNWKLVNWRDLGAICFHKLGSGGVNFEHMMTRASGFECTQAQDRIYAVLGLVNDGPPIQPDYTKPIPDVFMDATRKIIALRKNLHIFGCVFHPNEASLQSSGEEWPTWVPRWNHATVPLQFNKPYANYPVFASEEFQSPSPLLTQGGLILDLRGFGVGSVQVVTPDRKFPFEAEDGPSMSGFMMQKVMDAWKIITEDGGLIPSRTFSPIRCLIWTLLCGVEHPGQTAPDAEEIRTLSPQDLYRDFASMWAYNLLAHLSNGDLGGSTPRSFLVDRLGLSELATAEYYGHQNHPQNIDRNPPQLAKPTRSRCLNYFLRVLWRLVPAPGGQSFETFLQAYGAGTILEGRFDSNTAAELSNMLAPYLALARDGDITDIRGRFGKVFMEVAPLRRFFLLDNGKYACMGPSVIREGDVVVVLFGGTVPYALRPVVDNDGGQTYMLLGECYVYGLMNGEFEEEMRGRCSDLAAEAETFRLR